MSSTSNSINNTIGSTTTDTLQSHLRSAAGQWHNYNDQTDEHGYYSGVGSPEGVVAADIGSVYTDTGAGASGVYYKTTDTVNTGWTLLSGGSVVQQTQATNSTGAATTAVIPLDNTIPQNTEGTLFLTHNHTPQAAGNILKVEFFSAGGVPGGDNLIVSLFDGVGTNAIVAGIVQGSSGAAASGNAYVSATITAPSTAAIPFTVRFGSGGGSNVQLNAVGGPTHYFGAAGLATLRVTEYSPPGGVPLDGQLSVVNQTFTTPGAFVYTPTPGMVNVMVELVGGGGGAGGCAATAGGFTASTSGSSGGGYAKFLLTASQVGASLSGVVGAAGTGGAAGNNPGTNGGATTLATTAAWTAGGGLLSAGSASAATANPNGINGGTVISGTGTILATNQGQRSGPAFGSASIQLTRSGDGADSIYGAGGKGNWQAGLAATNISVPAFPGFGAGASGCASVGVSPALAGSAGSSGIAIFTEYVVV